MCVVGVTSCFLYKGLLLSPVKKGAPLPQFTSPIKPTKGTCFHSSLPPLLFSLTAAGSADGGQIPTSCGEEGPAKKEGRKRVPSDNGDSAAACAPKRRSNRVSRLLVWLLLITPFSMLG